MSAFVPPPTRFLVTHFPVYDSILGQDAPLLALYSGYVRRHPWASRQARNELLMDGRGVALLPNGDVYDGDTVLGMFEGMGTMRYANGDVYEGQWEGGLRHGYGVLDYTIPNQLDAEGNPMKASYTGLFRRGERQGAGFDEYGNGDKFVGQFKEGTANGAGRMRLADAGIVMDGVFKDGLMSGLCTVTYPTGDTFVGMFVHGVPSGKARYEEAATGITHFEEYAPDGSGRCVLGVLDSSENAVLRAGGSRADKCPLDPSSSLISTPTAHLRYPCGTREYVGGWRRTAARGSGLRHGVREGHGTLIFSDLGVVYVGAFKDDCMDGEGIMTFPPHSSDGGPAQMVEYNGEFHANKFHGRATVRYSDGTTCEQFFSKGYPKGLCHEQRTDATLRSFFNEMVSIMVDSRFVGDDAIPESLNTVSELPNEPAIAVMSDIPHAIKEHHFVPVTALGSCAHAQQPMEIATCQLSEETASQIEGPPSGQLLAGDAPFTKLSRYEAYLKGISAGPTDYHLRATEGAGAM